MGGGVMGGTVNSASSSDNGSQGTARWSLRLLGGFELALLPAGERLVLPGKRERLLLAYLVLSPNGRASRRKLTAMFWEDTAEEAALHSLRNCLSIVRKSLGDAKHRTLSSQGEDVALDLAAFDTDVLTFRRLAALSDRAELEAAARLCTGDLLDGLDIEGEEFESWRRTESACHRDQSVDVLTRLMAQFEAAGETERAIETGTRILAFEPLHEGAARRLMRLYGRSGRRGAAMAVYRSLAAALRAQVGAEPEAETRTLFADLSRGTEGVLAPLPTAGRELEPPGGAASHPNKATGPLSEARVPSLMAISSRGRNFKLIGVFGAVVAGAQVAVFLLAMFLGPWFLTSSRVPATQSAADAADEATAIGRNAVTIAVLPFANLSGDASQEFFSDGITEEINTALAKVPGLNVIARTSAFTLDGQNKDARTAGQLLGATHLIAGSVRKAGQRVRIAAQLVRANDNVQVWSQSYERNVTDIFAIQEEIATSISGALRVPLGLSRGENLVNNRSIDPESYEHYLRGKALFLARGLPGGAGGDRNLQTAATLLGGVIASNPTYAPGWAYLGAAYFGLASNTTVLANLTEARGLANEFRIKGESAGQKASQLDGNLPAAYDDLAVFAWSRAKALQSEEFLEKALALDPGDANALGAYAIRMGTAGQLKKALELAERALRADPFYPTLVTAAVEDRWLNGQNESAIALAMTLRANDRARLLAVIYASLRRFGEAADALKEFAAGEAQSEVAQAARLLRMLPARPPAAEELPHLPRRLGMLYLYLGAPELALQDYEKMVEVGFLTANWGNVWHADYAPVRKTERFKVLMRRAGLVDYWRVKGWPEQCRPITGDDFACD
jgi:adenylate cyclase